MINCLAFGSCLRCCCGSVAPEVAAQFWSSESMLNQMKSGQVSDRKGSNKGNLQLLSVLLLQQSRPTEG
jgi:hypothetical protein